MKHIETSVFGYEHQVCDFGPFLGDNLKMTFVTY
jgi:hypothetical protein